MREPVWTAENINRKQGETDFVQCGWCRYTSGGNGRYGCMLETSCELLPRYRQPKELFFDTPCLLKKMGKDDILVAAKTKSYEANNYRHNAVKADKQHDVLIQLALNAKETPVLPDNRDCNHFEIGKKVRGFWDGQWFSGTVIQGYRSGDGCVSMIRDLDNKESVWGLSVPSMLLETEFQYFREHLDEYDVWLKLADREYNGKRIHIEAMREALIRG